MTKKENLILKVFLLTQMVKKFQMIILKNFYLICFLFLILLIQSFFYKTLGSKKLAFIFKQKYNIIINHKKIYRLKKELGFVRTYNLHPKHQRKRPKNHDISKPNQYWESDIKFIPTKYDGYIPVLSIIDAFDKSIVGVYIGHSIKAKDFTKTMQKAIDFRSANTENLIIRTDNGPQFKAKLTDAIMKELNITHEFGYKNNPNSHLLIEFFMHLFKESLLNLLSLIVLMMFIAIIFHISFLQQFKTTWFFEIFNTRLCIQLL